LCGVAIDSAFVIPRSVRDWPYLCHSDERSEEESALKQRKADSSGLNSLGMTGVGTLLGSDKSRHGCERKRKVSPLRSLPLAAVEMTELGR
jgi:hypothetical protein